MKTRDSLHELYLNGTHLSDRGVDSFTHLEPIWSLSLERTHVTDQGVAMLAPLENLRLLSLEDTAVVGYGLCELPSPPEDIYLDGCPVTDDAVKKMATHLPGLRRLALKNTAVTDDCLAALAELTKLESLRLTRTQVTDKGIASFRGHPSLFTLEVRDTFVSKKEEERLEESSPLDGMCVIC